MKPLYAVFTLLATAFALLLFLMSRQLYGAPTQTAQFTIGERFYVVNQTVRPMDVSPYIKNDRTFLPVRYAAYGLGVPETGIIWD